MSAEYEFWPRWKPLPEGYERMEAGHTERAILVRRKPREKPSRKRRAQKGIEDGETA